MLGSLWSPSGVPRPFSRTQHRATFQATTAPLSRTTFKSTTGSEHHRELGERKDGFGMSTGVCPHGQGLTFDEPLPVNGEMTPRVFPALFTYTVWNAALPQSTHFFPRDPPDRDQLREKANFL